MKRGLYMGRFALPMIRPMCFDGPVQAAARECGVLLLVQQIRQPRL